MLRRTCQRMTRSRREICHDIFKVCRDIKFRVSITRQEDYVATEKFFCRDNHNMVMR